MSWWDHCAGVFGVSWRCWSGTFFLVLFLFLPKLFARWEGELHGLFLNACFISLVSIRFLYFPFHSLGYPPFSYSSFSVQIASTKSIFGHGPSCFVLDFGVFGKGFFGVVPAVLGRILGWRGGWIYLVNAGGIWLGCCFGWGWGWGWGLGGSFGGRHFCLGR